MTIIQNRHSVPVHDFASEATLKPGPQLSTIDEVLVGEVVVVSSTVGDALVVVVDDVPENKKWERWLMSV